MCGASEGEDGAEHVERGDCADYRIVDGIVLDEAVENPVSVGSR